ncbi:response regulator transcription factor [Phragmitibacter flavus]|uniref:Response regulator transcription factor n=1 Tax=Phragmitibacter flavus TaxID=2576071 RepID=A0A5R8KG42_9BACT|nr:response regulator transcription factor [Phragmitibacter flavus]TLD71272.1 response regulator transcription factor [Phragmitibacter flavus]
MKRKIRILIVDDHAMMRLGLAEAIAAERDFNLIGEASNGTQALHFYREHQPDVVTMDFRIPGPDGAESTAMLRAEFPDARIVLLSIFEGEEDIWRAVQAGASGYVSKSAEIEELLEAIRVVHTGGTYFPAAIAAKLAARQTRDNLTPRELQALRHIVAGFSNKEIAARLHMSEATVKLHISNTLAKLNVADRTQAAIIAVRRGIIHLDA